MLKVAIHKNGQDWLDDNMRTVRRVRPVSPEARKDGSPDGIVFNFDLSDVGGRVDADGDKLVVLPESVEEVDGLIRQLGELKSRMLKASKKVHTVFGA